MPLFEYKCEKCGKVFEKLIFSTDKEPIRCPVCNSESVSKILSSFSSNLSCPSSGSGFK